MLFDMKKYKIQMHKTLYYVKQNIQCMLLLNVTLIQINVYKHIIIKYI